MGSEADKLGHDGQFTALKPRVSGERQAGRNAGLFSRRAA
jgi:hypothetical protein